MRAAAHRARVDNRRQQSVAIAEVVLDHTQVTPAARRCAWRWRRENFLDDTQDRLVHDARAGPFGPRLGAAAGRVGAVRMLSCARDRRHGISPALRDREIPKTS